MNFHLKIYSINMYLCVWETWNFKFLEVLKVNIEWIWDSIAECIKFFKRILNQYNYIEFRLKKISCLQKRVIHYWIFELFIVLKIWSLANLPDFWVFFSIILHNLNNTLFFKIMNSFKTNKWLNIALNLFQ